MTLNLRIVAIGVLFFTGQALTAQKKKADSTTTKNIDEVVILGTYGIKESQEQKVGSYSLIKSKVLEKPNAVSLDLAIAGQAAGVVINANSGQPGSNARVTIRGISSLTGNTQPLYVIDGVPVLTGDQAGIATTSNALAMINPADIESIEVLKDGVTTSIYGSRGAAGVIVIKTKSGKKGGKFNFNSEFGAGAPAFEKYKFLNAAQQIQLMTTGYMSQNFSEADARQKAIELYNWDGKTDVSWKDATRRNSAITSRSNINYSGGSDNATIYASLGYTDQEGITRDATYNRVNATLKANWKMTDKLVVSMSNILSRSNQKGPLDYGYFQNPILGSKFINNTQPVYNADGSYNLALVSGLGTPPNNFNLVALQDINKRKSTFTKILSSLGVDYSFAKNFRFSSNLGIDYNSYNEHEWANPDFGDGSTANPNGLGYGMQSDNGYEIWNWSNLVHYNVKLGNDQIHEINVSAGAEATSEYDKFSFVTRRGYNSLNYNQTTVSAGANIDGGGGDYSGYKLIGYIARASYGFKELVNLTGSFRRDGYSHFGDNFKYGNFAAGGFNVNLHKIDAVSKMFDNLQLRASYGAVGNTGGQDYYYQKYSLYGLSTYQDTSAYTITSPGNENLRWEKSKKYNVGLDIGILQNRVKLTVDLYRNIINDQLTPSIPNAGSTGFSSLVGNSLASTSQGVEANLNLDIFKNENFQWTLSGNFSYNDSEVTGLTSQATFLTQSFGKRYTIGHNPTEWYLYSYAGVDKSNGDALWYTDASKTTTTNDTSKATEFFTGFNALPKYNAGLTNTLTVGNFSANILMTYAGGYHVYDLWERYFNNDGQDFLGSQELDALNGWTPDNPNSDRPQFRPGNPSSRLHSTRYLYKGDHIRLKSADLGYRLNKNALGLENANSIYLYIRGVNLATIAFDKNLKFDPEANANTLGTVGGMGVYDQTQPNLRQFLFGVSIDF